MSDENTNTNILHEAATRYVVDARQRPLGFLLTPEEYADYLDMLANRGDSQDKTQAYQSNQAAVGPTTERPTLELSAEWVNILRRLSPHPPDNFVKELAVVELYRRHFISGGKAAELLGMERFEFIRYASRLGVSFLDMSPEEMTEEAALVQALV